MIILTLEILLEALWESQRRKLNGTLIPECSGGGSGVFHFSMSTHKCVCWLTRPSRVCTSGRTPECHRAVPEMAHRCALGWKALGCWVQWELHQGDPGSPELRCHTCFPRTTAVLVASQEDSVSIKEGDFSEIVVNEDFSCLVSLWFIWLSVWRVVRVVFLEACVLLVFSRHFSVGFGS